MIQTLTEFFHSWWWEGLVLATSLLGTAIADFLYFDLEGMMKKKTLCKIVAFEMLFCSTYGFGDIMEMINTALLPLASAAIFFVFFYSLRESFYNSYF